MSLQQLRTGGGPQRIVTPSTGSGTAELPIVPSRGNRPPATQMLHGPLFQIAIPGVALIFLLVTIIVSFLGREMHPEGTIPPGVHVAGAYIGELDADEARAELVQRFETYAANPVRLTFADQVWEPTLADLGAVIDFDQTVERAALPQSTVDRARTRVFGARDRDLPIRITVDDDALDAWVQSLAEEIDTPPKAPGLALEGDRLTVTSAVPGIEIDRDSVRRDVRSALFTLERETIAIPHTEVDPAFDDADVELVRTVVNDALSEPLTIWFEDQRWTLEPAQMVEFLTLERAEDGSIELGFLHDPLIGHLDALIGDINRPPRNAQIAWGGQSVVATNPSQNGIERDLQAMIPRLQEAIATGQREVELTYNVIRPAIDSDNLEALGIDGLMAQGESSFWNSDAARIHNIGVSASYLDGTVIPPGHEFSFNQAVGEISIERGYQEGYVIAAEQTVEGVGGGVCQVSTTVFRAAFFTGLPITERNPHSYIVGYYEQGNWPLGFDAAIYQPGVDFRFVNTTDSYMLMHTHVIDQHIYVNFYGPDLGYTVDLGEPVVSSRSEPPPDVEIVDESLAPGARRQVEWAKHGLEITLPRTVTNRNGEVVRQDYFYSNFQPWANRYLVGPSTSPAAQPATEAPAMSEPDGEILEAPPPETET